MDREVKRQGEMRWTEDKNGEVKNFFCNVCKKWYPEKELYADSLGLVCSNCKDKEEYEDWLI